MSTEISQDFNEFIRILETEHRLEAVNFIRDMKAKHGLSIIEVYETLLTPALNEMTSSGNENIDIWQEHIRTSLIKTIIENLLPDVEAERKGANSASDKTVAVICPPEEYHDVGARMAADVLSIAGFNVVFVGSNTPLRVFEAGLASEKINFIAISISNPYHLVSARRIIDGIRSGFPGVRVIIGGHAIQEHPDIAEVLHADFKAASLHDLLELKGGIKDETGL